MTSFESYRQLLLDTAKLLFLVGVVVGFLSPLYFAIERYYFLYIFMSTLPSFLFEVAISLIAAFLSLDCYRNVKKGKLRVTGFRGVIAGALLIITQMWLAGFLVLVGGIISSMYQAR
ncbi:hypothetical protein GWO13_11350 [Candidatus Bathyarchaeota archaeon]|nr:hypothetical protein [Candidatus Bathyarchaeota archaeon]